MRSATWSVGMMARVGSVVGDEVGSVVGDEVGEGRAADGSCLFPTLAKLQTHDEPRQPPPLSISRSNFGIRQNNHSSICMGLQFFSASRRGINHPCSNMSHQCGHVNFGDGADTLTFGQGFEHFGFRQIEPST